MFSVLGLTVSYDSLQADDIRVVKLGHYGCLSQEVPLLLLRVSCLQSLQRHWDVPFPREPHPSIAHLPKLA